MEENKQKTGLDQAQKLLSQLKNDFLIELPDKVDDIESMILLLEQPTEDHENFERLFRTVHSLKGSAGTHGIATITFISHQVEDALTEFDKGKKNPELIDTLLSYLDLIRRTGEIAKDDAADYAEIHKSLENIRSQRQKGKYIGLIVEDSAFMSKLYIDSIEDKRIELIVVEDGLEALGRLLREKYDFVIMGAETKSLNGTALLYALRAAGGLNKDIQTIMVTSKDQPTFVSGLEPNSLLHKNRLLSQQLDAAVMETIPS